ncbi:MAG: hypothetical protein ACJA1I_001861 [Zhongshania marina]|jgi:hypothetical protein
MPTPTLIHLPTQGSDIIDKYFSQKWQSLFFSAFHLAQQNKKYTAKTTS